MARKFRGESVHKVDGKGRVSIPAPFRRVLEANDPDWTDGLNPNLVLVYGGKKRHFLEAFSMTAMADVDARIDRMKRGTKERRALENLFTAQAAPMQVDETGRLVLSAKLREKFNITDEAVFAASGDTFQIWSPAAYDENQTKLDEWIEEFDEDFDPLTLLDDGFEE